MHSKIDPTGEILERLRLAKLEGVAPDNILMPTDDTYVGYYMVDCGFPDSLSKTPTEDIKLPKILTEEIMKWPW